MSMQYFIDDARIKSIEELIPPARLLKNLPASLMSAKLAYETRLAIHKILHGADSRLLVIIGPCSIHDPEAAFEYGKRLQQQIVQFKNELLIVMRVYFEKPRTTIGWKGLINDPLLNNSYDINNGIRIARKLLLDLSLQGVPAGTEFLDMITPQYIGDLICWGAIGARTTESQVHRELASGLSCPIGFKNGTDGNVKIAVDAIKSSCAPHHFLSITKAGHSAIVSTIGNEDCHIILRGGKQPNYDRDSVQSAAQILASSGIAPRIMVDCSHANSHKDYRQQMSVVDNICEQISQGSETIIGTMVESNLVEGRQDLIPNKPLVYGQSITDACIGWDESLQVLEKLALAVQKRQILLATGH